MATQVESIQQLYIAYFNRPADAGGLAFWLDTLSKGGTLASISKQFAAQAEYKATYGGMSADATINQIYQNLFNRSPDVKGLDFWSKGLQNGTYTIDNIVELVAASAQQDPAKGPDTIAIQSKVAAAVGFTDYLNTNIDARIAYSTGASNQIAKDYIHSVVDATTLAAATTSLPTVAGTIISGSHGGTTFNLTQGLDTIAGTAGNDTINAFAFNSVSGANVDTLNSVDTIDGGAGIDTLNIEVKANGLGDFNDIIQGTISNVEIINFNNTAATSAGNIDASLLGAAATNINQIGKAADISNLAATTTAGFKGVTATVASDLDVTAAAAATSVSISLDGVKGAGATAGAEVENRAVIDVAGAALSSVTVKGTLAQTTTTAGAAAASLGLNVTAGAGVQTVSINTAVKTTLTVTDGSVVTKPVTAVDASASTGGVTYVGTANVASIKSGSGDDVVTVRANTNVAAGSVAAIGATVATGAGDDKITVDTGAGALASKTGTTTIDAGAGDDTVAITTRSDGKLTVNLGAGSDSLTSAVAILGTDAIDAGEGVDTLLLSLVGSSNVEAFSNFDVFDVAGMTANLDLDILNVKNKVAEIVGSAGVAAASVTLQNVGAGVNFRATGDMFLDTDAGVPVVPSVLTLTQKVGGALTVTLDADEAAPADDAIDTAYTNVVATNATSLKAVFDTSFLATRATETTAGDNVSTIVLAGGAATSLEIVSGGALSNNVLSYNDAATGTNGKLASITITGDRAITLSNTFAATNSALATVDSSKATGGLTFSLANLKDTGSVSLGSGVDSITVTNSSTGDANHESIIGLEKALAVSVSAVAGDAVAKAAAIADADTLVLAGATVANVNAGVTAGTIDKGVLTFTGTGPATLAAAIAIANTAAETAGEAVVFQYVGNTYAFVQGAVTDTVVKLVGITGVTDFAAAGSDHFFIV